MKYRLIVGTINHYAPEEGWENLHLDASPRGIYHHELHCFVQPEFVMSITDMTALRQDLFDEVKAHHVLEHLTQREAELAIPQIHRVLKPGGVLDIEVPNLDVMCKEWLETKAPDLLQWFYSEDVDMEDPEMNAHRSGWNEHRLGALLRQSTFKVESPLANGLALRYRATKRETE